MAPGRLGLFKLNDCPPGQSHSKGRISCPFLFSLPVVRLSTMPISGFLAVTIFLCIVCSFFPGFYFVSRLRWTPLEKLCGAVGLSLILIYLAAWTVYCFGPQNQRPAFWAIAGIAAVLAIVTARDALRFIRSFRIVETLRAFAFLLAWTFP